MKINLFHSNLIKSQKLKFKRSDFFIKIKGYGRNKAWADEVIKTTDRAVDLIKENIPAENVLKDISTGVRNANTFAFGPSKRFYSGILRTDRDGWDNKFLCDLTTKYSDNKYKVYEKRFDYVAEHPLGNSYKMDISRPRKLHDNTKAILHASCKYVNNSLNHIFQLSQEIFPKYLNKKIKQDDLKKINSIIAEIRWILAHSTPWMRGSDTISNVFIRAIYKALGIKSYPVKKNTSLDLEAFCTELNDYKDNFTRYFTKPPKII